MILGKGACLRPEEDLSQIITQLSSGAGVFKSDAERDRYIADARPRILIIAELLHKYVAAHHHRVLELGSNPYIMTSLLRRQFQFELTLANYFNDQLGRGPFVDTVTLGGELIEYSYHHFNIETQSFPFGGGAFDCVLFCEILEHLLIDPARAVREIYRVTSSGGLVFVSTPNATRLPNLYFMARGKSVWDGYSANGPYGRHNREFTLAEVCQLLSAAGFSIIHAEARNLQRLARRFTYFQWLRPSVWNEHLFVVGRKR